MHVLCAYLSLLDECRIRDITKEVAAAVIKEAIEEDLAEGYREMDARELRKLNQVLIVLIQFSSLLLCSLVFWLLLFMALALK